MFTTAGSQPSSEERVGWTICRSHPDIIIVAYHVNRHPHPGPFSISQHLRATKELSLGEKYAHGSEIFRVRTPNSTPQDHNDPGQGCGQTNELEWARELRLIRVVFFAPQLDSFEQGTFEILQLIRSWRNTAAPINRIPPEALSLIPDFEGTHRDLKLIALIRVCWAWREAFMTRSLLWTNLDDMNVDKAEVYLERSKSSPINLSLCMSKLLHPHDPFLRIIPRAIG